MKKYTALITSRMTEVVQIYEFNFHNYLDVYLNNYPSHTNTVLELTDKG